MAGTELTAPEVVHRPSRLRALAALEANAESSADALDRIAAMACRLLDAPVALVNLVGADRQRFIGCGDPAWSTREMPVTHGFCPFALGADEAFAFADAHEDPALAANPVVEQLGVVAYAGVPLRAVDGEPIGTLCAIDREPHEWSPADIAVLSDLAASAVAELQLLAASRRAVRQEGRVRRLGALGAALAPADSAQAVADGLLPAVGGLDASAVWLLELDASGRQLRTAAVAGAPARHDGPALDAHPALAGVARTGEPAFLSTRDRSLLPDAGSVALLPLAAGEQRLGVLAVGFPGEHTLSTDDRSFLTALAGIASLALARAGR